MRERFLRLLFLDLDSEQPCLKGLSMCGRRGRRLLLCLSQTLQVIFSSFPTLTIGFSIVVVISALYLGSEFQFFENHRKELSILSASELLVILFASFISNYNFRKTIKQIQGHLYITPPGSINWYLLLEERFFEQFFSLCNIAAFIFAIWHFSDPITLLWAINCIYLLFVSNNILQLRVSSRLAGRSIIRYAHPRLLHLQRWLRADNGPAAIGYAAVITFLTIFPIKDIETLKAFAGGVAGYHLALSTFSYFWVSKTLVSRFIGTNLAFLPDPSGMQTAIYNEVHGKGFVGLIYLSFAISTCCLYWSLLQHGSHFPFL